MFVDFQLNPTSFSPNLTKSKFHFTLNQYSSSLALMEETGIIGALLFYLPLIYILRKNIGVLYYSSKKNDLEKIINVSDYRTTAFYIAFLISLIIHSQFEAWCVGVGSVQLPLYYIILFCNYEYMKNLGIVNRT